MDTPTLERWDLRGPLRTMASHGAEWDPTAQDWAPPNRRTHVAFDEQGRVRHVDDMGAGGFTQQSTYVYESGNRLSEVQTSVTGQQGLTTRYWYEYDDRDRLVRIGTTSDVGFEQTIETCTYDEQSHRTTVLFLPEAADGYGVDGSEYAYGAPGARTRTTRYDGEGRSIEAIFHDAAHQVVQRVTFLRDAAGRTIREEAAMGIPLSAMLDNPHADVPPEQRETLRALLQQAADAITTTCAYDARGLLVERVTTIGSLSEERHLFRYDDHDNPVSEITEERDREIGVDENWTTQAPSESRHWSEARWEYVYDSRGNWTERIGRWRSQADAPFMPSTIERRTLEYYAM